ncbi:unnamed protein product, partial [Brachionus calyciflorus]
GRTSPYHPENRGYATDAAKPAKIEIRKAINSLKENSSKGTRVAVQSVEVGLTIEASYRNKLFYQHMILYVKDLVD